MAEQVVFYTTDCPRCKILEQKMQLANINYKVNNNVQEMLDRGLKFAPAIEVDGELMDFRKAVDWIKEQ